MIYKFKLITTVILFLGIINISTTGAINNKNISNNPRVLDNNIVSNFTNGYTNITVEETWDFLNSTSNGIQIPIDVRTNQEWINWHIDTHYPEEPKHHILTDLQDPVKLQEFMELYADKEIIIYCHSGVRSWAATNILINNNFTGEIYNMPAGIVGWSASGYPTVGNRNPNKPFINGPNGGQPDTQYSFTFVSTDPDYDNIYLFINWSDGSNEVCLGPYESGEEVNLTHSWTVKNTYTIKSKALDPYGNESEETKFKISISKNKITSKYLIKILYNKFPILKLLLNCYKISI